MFCTLFALICSFSIQINSKLSNAEYTVIKNIGDIVYVGGKDYLSSYSYHNDSKLILNAKTFYHWPSGIMNGSDIGFTPDLPTMPHNISRGVSSLAWDNCLNWKDEHSNGSVRSVAYDYSRMYFHTTSGNWNIMNYTCSNNFIKGIEEYGDNMLWICGTFGTFPKAFLVNKTNLEFIKFVDTNVMSCARYVDEPMVTYKDKSSNQIYVASGWGLYKPDQTHPDIPNNNSTMMYSDWRLYRNLFTMQSSLAWVLSSDVNFIKFVEETDNHLYFFGHEVSSQYGLNNQEDRNAWQSFLLRICKNDLGFKFIPTEIGSSLDSITGNGYFNGRIDEVDYKFALFHHEQGYNKSWYEHQVHLPTTHFATPLKINFGCFIGKKPRSISDNHFWGDTNVVYLNRLADVIFNSSKRIKFRTKSNSKYFGCNETPHSQIPLVGLFNRAGIMDSGVEPVGALCQLQINENIFIEVGSKKPPYHKSNLLEVDNAYEEIMALSSTSVSNFYSRTLHRTNGYTLSPYWNQGVLIGAFRNNPDYKDAFKHVGSCEPPSFYKTLEKTKFIRNMNFSNTAWPNELPNRLTSLTSAVCQYSAAELYSFNATFVIPGVEFKRIFLIQDNITNYVMHNINKEKDTNIRRLTSPLMIVGIVSTRGEYFRVVLCDFDNAIVNHGEDHTTASWYNWCIFRHTDQPYLYRQYTPMENRERGEPALYRASSLLLRKKIVIDEDFLQFPINSDSQFHTVKDILRKGSYIHVVTTKNIHKVSLLVDCTSFDTCINCASDPLCMWNIKDGLCLDYKGDVYDTSKYIQDVLDRGFRCGAIQLSPKTIYFKNNKVVSLYCRNAGFWRGKIEWRNEDTSVTYKSSSNIVLSQDNSILTLLSYNETSIKISCYGLRDDHDTLYGGSEYDHIKAMESIKLLNSFQLESSFNYSCIIIVFIVIIILLVVVFISMKKHKRFKRCFNSRGTKENETKLDEQFIPVQERKVSSKSDA